MFFYKYTSTGNHASADEALTGVCFSISPTYSKAFFAMTTAMISLMMAAAAIVPWRITAEAGSKVFKVVAAMAVYTRDTLYFKGK